ncbi:MAG: glycosyltransferase [Bacteroidales bacterium]|nr:glycosyltransferase [Bacteroidales bacterium]
MPKISAVIITLNEEKNLDRCLSSVLGVADEILVVDSFSTDRTEEIAKKYNARFIQHKFEGYIEQKNWATDQATYDFVLSLDADEMLSDTLKASILAVKYNWTHDGYTFNRLTNYCGRWIRYTSWYPSRKLRLYDRRKGQWEGINPHDAFVMKKGSRIKHLKGDLLHYSFYTIGQQIAQINKFSDLQSQAFYYKGFRTSIWSILVKPLWRFFRDYFIKLGFLDGFYGFVISVNGAYEVYLKYLKLKKIIDIEKSRTPYRICFFTSRKISQPFELQYIADIKNADESCTRIILMAACGSELLDRSKKTHINYIGKRVRALSWLGIVYVWHLIRVFKQLRIRIFVINNIFDARLLNLCSWFGLKGEIYFHIGEKISDETKLLQYLAQNANITKVFVNEDVNLNDALMIADKLVYLPDNHITSSHLQRHPKVAVLLDKIHRPNCGLGRVSIDFSKALSEYASQHNSLTFNYIIYGKNGHSHLKNGRIFKLNDLYRFFSAHYDNFDILHMLHQTPSFNVAWSNKRVLTIHDLNFLFTKNKRKARHYLKEVQRMVDKADAVVFISHFTREICEQHLRFYPHQILKVIYNGVELPTDPPQQPAFIKEDVPFLFTIGQCLPKKNFHVLLPFVKLLAGKFKLVIAGENDTAYGSYLRKLIDQQKLRDIVIMPGPVTEAEKKYLYQNCSAFVFPSLAEGFGLPVIEAMLNKKPVFCSDRTSLKEIGNQHVFFWHTFDPEAMLDIFNRGMKDFDAEKSNAAYLYAQQFTWNKNAEEYYKLYQELLKDDTCC